MHPKEGKNTGIAARLRLCAESGIVENCNDYQKTFKLAACVPLTKMLLFEPEVYMNVVLSWGKAGILFVLVQPCTASKHFLQEKKLRKRIVVEKKINPFISKD